MVKNDFVRKSRRSGQVIETRVSLWLLSAHFYAYYWHLLLKSSLIGCLRSVALSAGAAWGRADHKVANLWCNFCQSSLLCWLEIYPSASQLASLILSSDTICTAQASHWLTVVALWVSLIIILCCYAIACGSKDSIEAFADVWVPFCLPAAAWSWTLWSVRAYLNLFGRTCPCAGKIQPKYDYLTQQMVTSDLLLQSLTIFGSFET